MDRKITGYFNQSTNEDENNGEKVCLDIANVEKEHLIKVLQKNNGNVSRSANDLGIRRNTLYNKIKKYQI